MSVIYNEIKIFVTSNDQLPSSVDLYLTSNENSQGIIYNDWKNGEELTINFEKVSLLMIIIYT